MARKGHDEFQSIKSHIQWKKDNRGPLLSQYTLRVWGVSFGKIFMVLGRFRLGGFGRKSSTGRGLDTKKRLSLYGVNE